MANFATPIKPVSTVSGNDFRSNRIIEEASQNGILAFSVVQVTSSDGGLQAWDGSTIASGIAGIAYEPSSNLGTTGLGAPAPLSPFVGAGAVAGTFGSVPNESSAVNISHGAPLNDGRWGLFIACNDTVFSAAFGSNTVATTPLVTDVGKIYGMTKDGTNNYWYVDKNKVTTSAVCTVIALDPRVKAAAGSQVFFVFLPNVCQQLSA
jgi:hypothetical protein